MSRLESGKFYGKIQNRYVCEGLLLSELRHDCGRQLPEHEHERAYLSTLLSGSYREEGQGRQIEAPTFSTIYHHAGMPHRDEVGHNGAWFFTIEIAGKWLDESCPIRIRDGSALMVEGPPLALRLFFSFRRQTLTPLEVENVTLELLSAVEGQERCRETGTPKWLRGTVETIQDDPAFPHTVRSLARDAGVHAVHLARVFRSRYGYSINQYVQGLRLDIALHALEKPEARIADVACDAGFADQSHLSRVLKLWTGVPPAALRKCLRESMTDLRRA